MKGDYSWETLELQVAGKDRAYRGVKVLPFIATLPCAEGDPAADALRADMPDASCLLPAEVGAAALAGWL